MPLTAGLCWGWGARSAVTGIWQDPWERPQQRCPELTRDRFEQPGTSFKLGVMKGRDPRHRSPAPSLPTWFNSAALWGLISNLLQTLRCFRGAEGDGVMADRKRRGPLVGQCEHLTRTKQRFLCMLASVCTGGHSLCCACADWGWRSWCQGQLEACGYT